IGDWDIRQRILSRDGTWLELPARTSVTPALDGCALVEHWQGEVQFFWEGMQRPEPMRGLSVRAWDPTERRWKIYWMDTRSPRFGSPYSGVFDGGRGEFFREWDAPSGHRLGHITFRPVAPDSVLWELAVSADRGQSWQTIWTMAMHRRAGPAD
ncbi:MAG TPA: hypothetical protein VNH46_10740, partial [Gemmatimonadales bacterium]|nr:hypothetical protein [Gemmatimonadales bacterium]